MKKNRITTRIVLFFTLSFSLGLCQIQGQSTLDKELYATIQKGDLQSCISLIDKGANVNAMVEGNAPLHRAISLHQNEIAQYLVKKGAKIDKKNKAGEIPLLLCMEFSNPKMGLYLIDKGADIELQLDEKQNLLHAAVYTNSPQILEVLLQKGLDPNALDKSGVSPLELTFYDWPVEISLLLLKYGASPDISIDQYPALILAIEEIGSEELANALIINGADPNSKDLDGYYAYDHALRLNFFSTAKLLLEKGADLGNSNERSILLGILEEVKDDSIKNTLLFDFIEAGVDPNISYNNTPLLYLVFEDNYFSTELRTLILEAANEDLLTKDFLDRALVFAVNFEEKELAKTLISLGSNASAESEYGTSILNRALWMGDIDFLTLLLDKGANVKGNDSNGANSISELLGVVTELGLLDPRSEGYFIPWSFEDLDPEKVKTYPENALRLLVKHGADINGKDFSGNTPLQISRQFGLDYIEKLLIELGAIDE